MSADRKAKHRVGELRPSQLLTTFGIGSVVDLPNLSVMVMGLDDWDITQAVEIGEERLRQAVQRHLGSQAKRLLAPPLAPEATTWSDLAFGEGTSVGVPVATFPRWMVCPYCRVLAPLDSGLFQLKVDPFRPDRTGYIHQNCTKPGRPPTALPARFLVACEHGHLDDFPWIYFVHQGQTECQARLRLREFGVSGEAADIQVTCEECKASRRMGDAFGADSRAWLPLCRGRRPHLRDYDGQACPQQMRTILLGASNSWFPVLLSALSLPVAVDKLGQLVDAYWHVLEKLATKQNVELLRALGQLPQFATYSDDEVWEAVERKRSGEGFEIEPELGNLKAPEWRLFTRREAIPSTPDFRLAEVAVPQRYEAVFERVALVERLREVSALIGFTRIASPGDFGEAGQL
ncbi:MAG TPA: DrmB family protein, partial [Ktedonobacterales bacterium]